MLAGAVRAYANRWAVAPGQQVSVLTDNDDGWRTAIDLQAKGVEIAAVIDTRDKQPPVNIAGALVVTGVAVQVTSGRKGLKTITLTNGQTIQTDCLAVAGGWNPNVHLTCHQRGRPSWNGTLASFIPGGELPPGMVVAGAANGQLWPWGLSCRGPLKWPTVLLRIWA